MTVLIASRCTACGACIITCPEAALSLAPLRPAVLDSRCTDCLACLEVCPVDSIVPLTPRPSHPMDQHPIEALSYRILYERVDLSAWEGGARAVVARMIHATADESFAVSARVGERAVEAATSALHSGAVVVCDARMVQAGIPSVANSTCLIGEVPADRPTEEGTRSAAAICLAATRHPIGALWVVGNTPTALVALLELYATG
ncbi:MAG: precorrin-8X methylmutase, partial [Acidimicrobiia bacterium]